MQRHSSKAKGSEGLVTEVRKWLRALQPRVKKPGPPAPGIYLMRLRAERTRCRVQSDTVDSASA